MERTVLTWSIPNLITVALMGAIGFALLRVIFTLAGGSKANA